MNNVNQSKSTKICREIGGRELCISTGELARQAGGSILVQYGDTVVLGTANMSKPMSEDADFFPLLVDYEEKFYAAGKIKGSRYIKREGRPSEEAILIARQIDRSIRPLFPEGIINDVQVVLTVLSYDGENTPNIPAMIAACTALSISDIPWDGPLAGVNIGRIEDKFITNPTTSQQEENVLDLTVAGTGDNIAMIEAGAQEVEEEIILDAIEEAQKVLCEIAEMIEEIKEKVGKEKKEPFLMPNNEDTTKQIKEIAKEVLLSGLESARVKTDFKKAEQEAVKKVVEQLASNEDVPEKQIQKTIHDLHGEIVRDRAFTDNWREGQRGFDEIRPLGSRVGILPRAHGSSLFQRGETQVLNIITLGGPGDVQYIDTMELEEKKRYIHHYNFPAFSVGENRPNRGPGRREIGHGSLAERALLPVLPDKENWPYTMLLVSEVLESNGSSSMGSVCGSSMSLMDAGVPIKKPVAGIAMGLFSNDNGDYRILTDIAGVEDEKGDMDFKVAGTIDGITALQMDIKVSGLKRKLLSEALEQAKKARLQILEVMEEAISAPRKELSPYAPRIETLRISVDKIGDLIGPKGKNINEIVEKTGVEIDIEDDGLVSITATDGESMEKARKLVDDLTREIKEGDRFDGKVVRIMDFGAFVELSPNVDGMVHISQFKDTRVDKVTDVVSVGDVIPVVVIGVDENGRISLSHKDALSGNSQSGDDKEKKDEKPFRGPRPPSK